MQLDLRFHPMNFGQTKVANGQIQFYPLHPCVVEFDGHEFPTLLKFHPDHERKDDATGDYLFVLGLDVILQGISINVEDANSARFCIDETVKPLMMPSSFEEAYNFCVSNLSDKSANKWSYDEFISKKLGRMNILRAQNKLSLTEEDELRNLGKTQAMTHIEPMGIPIGVTSTMNDYQFIEDMKLMDEMQRAPFIGNTH